MKHSCHPGNETCSWHLLRVWCDNCGYWIVLQFNFAQITCLTPWVRLNEKLPHIWVSTFTEHFGGSFLILEQVIFADIHLHVFTFHDILHVQYVGHSHESMVLFNGENENV